MGLCDLQIGLAFIQRTLGNKAFLHQVLVAFVVGLGDRHLCLRLLNFGSLQGVIELHQHLPFTHLAAIGKTQSDNAARDFRSQHGVLA